MKCPNGAADRVQENRDTVEMEICPACDGMGLNAQELAQLEREDSI
jgi:Zn-finger nucleic acid-binding protein